MRRLLSLLLAIAALPSMAAAQYSISSSTPASVPAGSTSAILNMTGTFDPTVFSQAGYAICVYQASSSSFTAITPSNVTATTLKLTLPNAVLSVNPTSFSSGEFDITMFVSGPAALCTTPPSSGTATLNLLYPQITAISLFAFPQPNPQVPTSYPTNFELTANNFLGASTTLTFDYSPGNPVSENVRYISDDGITQVAVAAIPQDPTAGSNNLAALSVYPCNSNATYTYCTTFNPSGANFFALSPTSLSASATPSTAYTGQSIALTATAQSTGNPISTDGGTYLPPAPGGTVTFTEGANTLGSAPLIGTALSLGSVGFQSINTQQGGNLNANSFTPLVADFNGDGVPDILLNESNAGVLHLFLGTAPTGNFQGEITLTQPSFCFSVPGIAVGDLNGDTYPDIAYLCGDSSGTASLNVLFNNGDGTFGNPVLIASANGDQLAIADVNHDGKLDLIITGPQTVSFSSPSTYAIQTFLGTGTGSFNTGPVTTTPDETGAQLIAKDLNGDNYPDLALLHFNNSTSGTEVSLWKNDGTGAFTLAPALPICNCTLSTSRLSALPLSLNKKYPDLVVALTDGATQSILTSLNPRNASLNFAQLNAATILATSFQAAVLADFNGDGLADVATYNGSTITVQNGDGTGNFPNTANQSGDTGSGLYPMAALDLNNDGLADIVSVSTASEIDIVSYITTGITTATLNYAFSAPGSHTVTATYAGDADVLGSTGQATVIANAPPAATILANAGSRSTSPTTASAPYTPGGTLSLNVYVDQPAGDSRPVTAPTGTVSVSENGVTLATATLGPHYPNEEMATFSNFEAATGGTHNLTLSYSGDANFSPSTFAFTYTVTQANPTLYWNPPASLAINIPVATIENATASVPGSFSYTFANGTYPALGSQSISALFTPTDSTDYATANDQRTLIGVKGTASITTLSTSEPYNSNYTFDAEIAGANITPTGSASLIDTTTSQVLGTTSLVPDTLAPASAQVHFLLTATPVGQRNVQVVYAGDSVYNSATSSVATITVTRATPVITWTPNPATIAYGTALSAAQLDATASVPGSFSYSPAAGYTPTAVGPLTVTATFTPTDITDYTTATQNATITVSQSTAATTSLTLNPSSITYGQSSLLTAVVSVPSTAPTGQVRFFDSTTSTTIGTVSLSGNSASVTYTLPTAGTHSIVASYLGDTNYRASSSTAQTLTVAKLTPTISWPSPTPIPASTALSNTQLDAVAKDASNNTVPGSYSYNPAAGSTPSAGVITLNVTFTPTDSIDYNTVSDSTQLTVLAPTTTVLTVTSNPTTINVGDPIRATVTSTSGTPTGTVSFLDQTTQTAIASNVPLVGGVATATFTPASTGNQTLAAFFVGSGIYNSSSATPVSVSVQGAVPTITWNPNPATIVYGTPLSSAQLDATSSVPGAFVYTPALGAILPVSSQTTLSTTFTPTDTTNYQTVTRTATITIAPFTPLVTWATPAPISYGTALSATQLNAVAKDASGNTIPGVFTYSPAAGTVLPAGAQQLSVTFIPTDTTDYTSTGGNGIHVTQVVNQGSATVTWNPAVTSIPYGTALSASQLNATASIPGTFVYNPALGTVLNAGTQTLNLTFTPTDSVNYQTTTRQATITVTQLAPTISWPAPGSINSGTALSGAQLNATATGLNGSTLPGVFTYTPPSGTILSPGPHALSLSFTPTDAVNYTTATASNSITVLNTTTTTTLTGAAPNPSQFDQPNLLTATATPATSQGNPPSGTFTFFDGQVQLAQVAATPSQTSAKATYDASTAAVGTHQFIAVYSGDATYQTSTSTALAQVVTASPTGLSWTPNPATIPYGTPLSAAQLDAVPTSPYAGTPAGTIVYTPAAGTILNAGRQTLTATFTPSAPGNFNAGAGSAVITVTQATPTLAWTPPAAITQGTPLSSAQLNATALGINQTALPGTFAYTPAAGAILPSGLNTLSVTFTPADAVNYTTKTITVPITVNIPAAILTLASPTNPTQYGQSTTLTATATPGGTLTAIPTGLVTFLDAGKPIGTASLNTAGIATLPISTLSTGIHTLTATYAGDTTYASSTATSITQTVTQAATVVTFVPNPSSISYGTALTTAQLDATAATAYIQSVPGAFVYTPALGALPTAGQTNLSVTFTPTDTLNFSTVTKTAILTVTKVNPAVTFPTPADAIVGTPLSATQLAATATGVTGTALPGTFTYTPAAGTLVTAGPQTLSVLFTPTDLIDYNPLTVTTTLNGIPIALTSLSSATAALGDPAKTITLTGTGFAQNSVVRSNGAALATTYVNPTTLQAVLPSTSFTTVATLQITVFNPTQNLSTNALPFTITAPPVSVILSGPGTVNSGNQPSLTFSLTNQYPVPLNGAFTLTFTPTGANGIDDPTIVFASSGTRTLNFSVAGGVTVVPTVLLQTGTQAGTITITLHLTAGGIDVTPTTLQPVLIVVPPSVPALTSLQLTRSGRQFTVSTVGYSNTRDITTAVFHFTPAAGQQLQTQDFTIDVSALFAAWYATAASNQYGSAFTYNQTFTLDQDASVVGSVTVTLSNAQGVSSSGSAQ